MATATKRPDVTEVIVKEKGGVTLDLSHEEAEVLTSLLTYVNSKNEKVTDSMYEALLDAGVSGANWKPVIRDYPMQYLCVQMEKRNA